MGKIKLEDVNVLPNYNFDIPIDEFDKAIKYSWKILEEKFEFAWALFGSTLNKSESNPPNLPKENTMITLFIILAFIYSR